MIRSDSTMEKLDYNGKLNDHKMNVYRERPCWDLTNFEGHKPDTGRESGKS